MPRTRTMVTATVAVAALAVGAALGVAFGRGGGTTTVTVEQPAAAQVSNVSSQLTVGEIARRSTKSVVEVIAGGVAAGETPFGGSRSSQAEGTGWVYDTNGHIVTNEHVIDGASTIKVVFSDGSSYSATVTGKDSSTDLAVLKVNAPASKLAPLTLGDSSAVGVGDDVVAIGDPFGLTGTVTTGIVSALNREIQAPNGTPIEGAIQTDAAINHGNSGGPLFDLQGHVIGITSQIESDSGASDGVGFAIPSNTVKSVAAQLLSSGTVRHAFLGVQPSTVAGTGVRVAKVEKSSAAARAGLKTGDVITAVDGKATASAAALRTAIDEHSPGDRVLLTITRSGATRTLHATLGTRP